MNSADFLSNENKGMIWQILSEQGSFNNIPNDHFDQVKQLYEKTLQQVSNMNQYNLTDKNKLILVEMSKNLPFLKQQESVKPLEEVKIKLNSDFKDKQQEFMKLVNHSKPAEPEFNDKEDKPIASNDMNTMLNEMMEMRESELSQINPNKKDIENLASESTQSRKNFNNSNHDGKCVDYIWSQFGNETNTAAKKKIEKQLEKKVSFDGEDFLSKLKTVKNTENVKMGIDNDLANKILDNQTKILDMLNTLMLNMNKV